MPYSVGKSSYPDLRGQTQYVASAEVAAQVASLAYEFDTQVAKGGDRLTVNEGIRSRERQTALFNDYLYRGGALAAKPFTSTHDASRGSALDFGITRRDGTNRALTTAEFAWLHARAPQRGIRWTGANFSRVEPWHHNGGYPASVAPIPGVNLPGEPIGQAANAAAAPPTFPEDDMPVIIAATPSNHWFDAAPGYWSPLDRAETAYAATGTSRANVIVISDSQVNDVRDYWLRKQPVKHVAVTGGPNKDQWFLVGPGVFYRIKAGEDFSNRYGSVVRVSEAEFNTLRAINTVNP